MKKQLFMIVHRILVALIWMPHFSARETFLSCPSAANIGEAWKPICRTDFWVVSWGGCSPREWGGSIQTRVVMVVYVIKKENLRPRTSRSIFTEVSYLPSSAEWVEHPIASLRASLLQTNGLGKWARFLCRVDALICQQHDQRQTQTKSTLERQFWVGIYYC